MKNRAANTVTVTGETRSMTTACRAPGAAVADKQCAEPLCECSTHCMGLNPSICRGIPDNS
jgi:hypothetical protein